MRNASLQLIRTILVELVLAVNLTAQSAPTISPPTPATTTTPQTAPGYMLGPDDLITLFGMHAEEIVNHPLRIDANGEMSLPMVGRMRAAGLTVQQFEEELNRRLAQFIRSPQIVVNVTEFRSQPVSVIGAVNNPGVHQLQGRKTLLEILSLAAGFRSDAGYSIKITRGIEWGPIPLPGAAPDASGKYTVAEVGIQEMMSGRNPAGNIQILPHDVVTVPVAKLVYVIGEVRRSGGFVLGERQSISVLQALSLAEGLDRHADSKHAKILRIAPGSSQRTEIAVDVKRILQGKDSDVALHGDDILFLPSSAGKKAATRMLEMFLSTGSGLLVYRRP